MAGPNDFTDQNIQDTYQRVLQISSSGEVTDGTGSLAPILYVTASHAISASHEITVEITSSYAQSASVSDKTDTVTNTDNSNHYVTFVDSNNALPTPETHYTAPWFYLNPAKRFVFIEGRLQVKGSDIWIESGSISASNSIYAAGSITASGNISASGDINAGAQGTGSFDHIITTGNTIEFKDGSSKLGSISADAAGSITLGGASTDRASIKVADVGATNGAHNIRLLKGAITSSGEISASNKIIAPQFDARTSGTGYKLSGAKALYTHDSSTVVGRTGRLTITGSSIRFNRPGNDKQITFYGNITASGDISASGVVYATQFSTSGAIGGGSLQAADADGTVTIQHGNITASGAISASGTIYADNISASNDIHVGTSIRHIDDDHTKITFAPNTMTLTAGGANYITLLSSPSQQLTLGKNVLASLDLTVNGDVQLGNAITDKVSISGSLFAAGSITASGAISASGGFVGDLTGNADTVTVASDAGNVTHYVGFFDSTTGQQTPKTDAGLTYNGSTNKLTTTTVAATQYTGTYNDVYYRRYTYAAGENGVYGDTVTFGTDAAGGANLLEGGKFYNLTTGLKWVPVDADTPASSSGMIGYCMTSRRNEFLIKGFIRNSDVSYLGSTDGAPLYISTGSGELQNCIPGSGDVARVIGYVLDASDYHIFMDPDKTWVKIA